MRGIGEEVEQAMGHGPADPQHWMLTADERANPSTELDRRGASGAAWSCGNLVRALVDGQEYFRRLLAELDDLGADDQVYFSAWIGDPTERLAGYGTSVGSRFARALEAGALVYALFWCPYVDARRDFVPENRSFVTLLRDLGAAAVLDQRVRAFGSHHQKFLVIRRPGRPETDVAFLGGIDPFPTRGDDRDHGGDPQVQHAIAQVYGQRPAWHDTHLEVRGPAVAEVEYCFRERFNDATAPWRLPFRLPTGKFRSHRGVELPEPLAPPGPRGPHAVQLLRTYPRKKPPFPFAPDGERSVARGYVKALGRAREFVYVEDQFLWSPVVAEVFAEALRRRPGLRLVAVVPNRPDKDSVVQVRTSDVAHRKALKVLRAAGGDRVEVYELARGDGVPIYVHSKVCVIDDFWAAVGSANLNRRSWTYDTELAAAVVDGSGSFARDLRVRLWCEHLGRDEHDTADLLDPEQGRAALRRASAAVQRWHEAGAPGPRPSGHLRPHPWPAVSHLTRAWAAPAGRLLTDPDGRPKRLGRKHRW